MVFMSFEMRSPCLPVRSPDGSVWRIRVTNEGVLIATEHRSSLEEVLRKAQVAANATREPFTFYFTTALIYLGLTVIIMAALHWFERRANRGYARTEL